MNRDLRKPESTGERDLEWIAFCYIADELTDSEKTEFETRLQNDLEAQQAVAVAMEQSQAIYMAIDQAALASEPVAVGSVTMAPRSAARTIPNFLFAAAATLLLVVAGWGWYANQPAPGLVENSNSESEQLADAWSYTLVAMNDGDWEESNWDEGAMEEQEDSEKETAELGLADESADDWMFVALTGMESSIEGAE